MFRSSSWFGHVGKGGVNLQLRKEAKRGIGGGRGMSKERAQLQELLVAVVVHACNSRAEVPRQKD